MVRPLNARRPVLALTMGDAAGIGPEVILRALLRPEIHAACRPLVVGDAGVMAVTLSGMGLAAGLRRVTGVQEAAFEPGTIDVLDQANIDLARLKRAQVDPMAGKAAAENVIRAIELGLAHAVDGIVTAPLNKQAMQLGGYEYPGHTELLAEKTGTSRYAMMFVAGDLRVVLVTIHCALRAVPDLVTFDAVLEKIELAGEAVRRLGIPQPRIAVAGLNPHAGESGLFGPEESKVLAPAITAACAAGLRVSGPFPADTLFDKAVKGQFDVVVAMYHDQGLIPVKLIGFEQGVNVTLGLPFVRTSPDHGTAFDRAWQWRADPSSMIAAIHLAARMAGTAVEHI